MSLFVARPLSFYESFFHYWGKKDGNFSIGEIVRFSSKSRVTLTSIECALELVCKQYAIWGSVVDDTHPGQWKWKARSVENQDFIIVEEFSNTHNIDDIVTRSISSRDTEIFKRNLLKVYFIELHSKESDYLYDIAFSHSHSTMDGGGFLLFLRAFLREIGGVNDKINEENTFGTDSTVDENVLIDFLVSKLNEPERIPQTTVPSQLLRVENNLSPENRNATLVRREFTMLSQLLQACKTNKTTLQSALVYALCIAQASQITKSKTISIGVTTPVDLRRLCARVGYPQEIYDMMGNLICLSSVFLDVQHEDPVRLFWEMARKYKSLLEQDITTGNIFGMTLSAQEGLKESPDDLFDLMSPDLKKNGGRVSNLNVSNIGNLDGIFGKPFGDVQLESLYGGSWSLSWGDCIYVLIASIRNTLHLTFASNTVFSEEDINSIVDSTMNILQIVSQ